MPINTAKVAGRRQLHFETLEKSVTDAEKLLVGQWKPLGNWSLGQITQHLATSLDNTVEGRDITPPLFVRLIMAFMKKGMLYKSMSPGFQMTDAMKPLFMPPDEVEAQEGVAALRAAVEKFSSAASLPDRSGAFGKMSRDQWTKFHCRHAEMHLSFIVPSTEKG